MKLTAKIAAIAVLTPVFCSGAVFNLKTGLSDIPTKWQNPSSYVENSAPGPGDVVVIPNTTTGYVDNATVAFVGSLKRVQTTGSFRSTVLFDITTNATVRCAINAQNTSLGQGRLVKRGAGMLTLQIAEADYPTTTGKNNYYTQLNVEEGAVRIAAYGDEFADVLNLQDVVVAEGATWFLPSHSSRERSVVVMSLTGGGTVSNDNYSAKASALYVGSDARKKISTPYVFSGKIGGNMRVLTRINTSYTGTENSFSSATITSNISPGNDEENLSMGAVMRVMKVGMFGEASSMGTTNVSFGNYGGCLYYLGTGETTDKTFAMGGQSAAVMVNGGANGNLTFTGQWSINTVNMRHILLGGEGGVCTLDNEMTGYTYPSSGANMTNYAAYVTKRGAGTWHFTGGHDRSLVNGVFAVENGTVSFDSMAKAGTMSSLGTATELFKPVIGLQNAANSVDYAYLLGGGTSAEPTTGTLAYAGTTNFWVNNRKISLNTCGKLAAESTGAIKWKGVEAGGEAGAKTLILGGAGTGENTLYDLADGENRPVSLVKEDAGEWTVSGDLTFSGALEVRGGTLNVIAAPVGTPYSYYRLVLMENVWNCSRYSEVKKVSNDKHVFQLQEFGLYDETGKRQNIFLPPFTNIMFNALKPGQAAFDDDKIINPLSAGRYLCRLFDGKSYDASLGINYGGFEAYVVNPSISDRNKWVPIVIRLTNSTPVIAKYDICCYLGVGNASNPGRGVTAYTLDGSVDGVHWERAAEDLEAVVPSGDSKWYASPDVGNTEDTIGVNGRVGFSFGGGRLGTVTNAFSTLASVSRLSVISGGVLRATAPVVLKNGVELSLDTETGGSLEGFVLPSEGTLSVTKLPTEQVAVLPATFAGTEGLENVGGSGWTLESNGNPVRGRKVVVKNGRIYLMKKGLVVTVH